MRENIRCENTYIHTLYSIFHTQNIHVDCIIVHFCYTIPFCYLYTFGWDEYRKTCSYNPINGANACFYVIFAFERKHLLHIQDYNQMLIVIHTGQYLYNIGVQICHFFPTYLYSVVSILSCEDFVSTDFKTNKIYIIQYHLKKNSINMIPIKYLL